MAEITILITCFERIKELERLLNSIDDHYKGYRVLIASCGRLKPTFNTLRRRNPVTIYEMPFDAGLSFMRNYLAERSKTPYFLLLEDDFVFTDKTDIETMKQKLLAGEDIGVVGGKVLEFGKEVKINYDFEIRKISYDNDFFSDQRILRVTHAQSSTCDCVANFALFRKACWQDNQWDDDLKIEGEHFDFYYRLKEQGKWKAFHYGTSEIDHKKNNSPEYKYYRNRKEFLIKMMTKNCFKKIIFPNGFTFELKDGVIVNYHDCLIN
jgi:hypothetical protein